MIFGITGGSGCGKTTVSNMLAHLGAEIIDTDKISRAVTGKGSACLKELTDAFGKEILLPTGELDRHYLASIAFADKEKTALLSRITHKYIKSETLRRIELSKSELIGIDGAVIIGSPVEELCGKIVCVTARRDVRIDRITARDGITRAEAEKRIDAQPDDEFYIKHGDYIVDNSTDLNALEKSVRELYDKLKGV